MYVGITHLGIVTFQGNKRTHQFKWYELGDDDNSTNSTCSISVYIA